MPGSCRQAAATNPTPPAHLPCSTAGHFTHGHPAAAHAAHPGLCSQGSTAFTHTCPPASPLAWKAISCLHGAVPCPVCALMLEDPRQLLSDAQSGSALSMNTLCTQQTAPHFHLLPPNPPPPPGICCLAFCTSIQCCHKLPLPVANSPARFPHLSVVMDSTLDQDLGDVGANLRACYRQFLSFSLCLCSVSRC